MKEHNAIDAILRINHTFRTFRLIILISTVSYFLGMVWYIFCELTNQDPAPEEEHPSFFQNYEIESRSTYENTIIMVYYAFTTLTTVGFGDFHPRSNAERLFCALILLVGVSVFSFFMGQFMDIIGSIIGFSDEVDEGENLSKWFGLIKRFNSGKPLDQDLKDAIEDYFDYRWAHDKNMSFGKEYENITEQLPMHVLRRIYSDYLFKPFRNNFKKFFDFPKDIDFKDGHVGTKIDYSFYTWSDLQY